MMAQLTDRKDRTWKVELDAPLIEEIKDKHSAVLTDLESDPLRLLRNDPMVLVGVLTLICQAEIADRGITFEDFGRGLPDADKMLEAIADAIVSFFPSGRHSHVREVLIEFRTMSETTDTLALTKMREILNDPNTPKRLNARADKEIRTAIDEMFPLAEKPGTSSTAAAT
jgi:hypothetical protein